MADRFRVLDGVCPTCKAILARHTELAALTVDSVFVSQTKQAYKDLGLVPVHYESDRDLRVTALQHAGACPKAVHG